MATHLTQFQPQRVQAEQIRQATDKDSRMLELNIEELEERIAPSYVKPVKG
jgi:hypothetical protein